MITMEKAKQKGIEILQKHNLQPNDAVMFDIDDTLIYKNMDPNAHIIELANKSREMGYKIVIITARPDFANNRQLTEEELRYNNIHYDLLFYSNHQNKHIIKKQLSSTFVLSVGDMWTDLTDTLHFIKLPCKKMNENEIICA